MSDIEKNSQTEAEGLPAAGNPLPLASDAEQPQPTSGGTDRPLVHLRSVKEAGETPTVTAALTNRGPILVLLVAYAVLTIWSIIGTVVHPNDSSSIFTTFFIITLVFEGASFLMTCLGIVAFSRTHVTLMGVYVWATIGLQVLGVASLALSIVAPVPQDIRETYAQMTEAALANNMPTDDIPTDEGYKITRTLFRAAGVLLRFLFIVIVRKYYLNAKAVMAKK